MEEIAKAAETITALSLDDMLHIMVSLVPAGLLLGMLMLLLGLGVSGIMKIFKRV